MDATRIAASPGMNAGMLVVHAKASDALKVCNARRESVWRLTYVPTGPIRFARGMPIVQMALVVKAQMKSVVPPDVIVILKPVSADAARRIVAQTSGCVSRAQMGIVEKNRTHVPHSL